MRNWFLGAGALLSLAAPIFVQASPINTSPAVEAVSAQALSKTQKENINKLLALASSDRLGYKIVESLTTEVGPRLAGSEAESRARDWAVDKLKRLGFTSITVEPFELPYWERGIERAEILAPFPQPLTITALGGSTSTGDKGVTGEVVSFPNVAALKQQKPGSLKGKIVFVDEVMVRAQDGSGYGVAAKKRRETAYIAHTLGAEAALIRSVGTSHHRFAHTGQMRRVTSQSSPSVPTAALSAPDADQLQRILAMGKTPKLHLTITTESRPKAMSGNVIAEIKGAEKPEEIVLIGGHLDSWDLGTGAVDDGAGIAIVMAAAKALMDADIQPKRTLRVVLFGSEEVGLVGAKKYAEKHKAELKNHYLAAESDFGADVIWRLDTKVPESYQALIDTMQKVLLPLNIIPGEKNTSGGPDLKYMREAGVPVVELLQNGLDYFDLHHTPNDTLDKIDPAKMAQNVAAYAVFAYLATEL